MIQTAQIRRNSPNWVADGGASELSAECIEITETVPAKTALSPDLPTAMASLVRVEQGLYAVEIGETAGMRGQISGLPAPMVQVSAPPCGRDRCVEIIGATGFGEAWLAYDGGTVIVRSPRDGGYVLVTAYGLPAHAVSVPQVEVRRLDRPRSNGAALGLVTGADEPEEVRTEVVLHVERLGDKRFPGQGWVGNRGKKLRIEAFSIRPIATLAARDIEFKALGPKGRQTPWVTDAKLCGTRGQGLPLTGFAIRLAPHFSGRFDVVYHGAFFDGGVVGPNSNGELCFSPVTDDPLEAINLRLIRRAAQ